MTDTQASYIVRIALGAALIGPDYPPLSEVLAECPKGYRLHSVVPLAAGEGYTQYLYVIFENTAPSDSTQPNHVSGAA